MVEKLQNCFGEFLSVFEMVGRQHFSLKFAEDNLDLIQPGGMNRKPVDLDLKRKLQRRDPSGQLFRGMRRAIIEDEMQATDFLTPEASEDRFQETLEVDEVFGGHASRQGFARGHQKRREEQDRPLAFVAITHSDRGVRGWLLASRPAIDGLGWRVSHRRTR